MFKKKKEKKTTKTKTKKKTTESSSTPHLVKFCEIQKATKNFDESLLIHRGCIGDVYYGELDLLDQVISVPVVVLRFTSPSGPTDSWPEIEKQRLYSLRHRNLVSLIAYCEVVDDWYGKETILVYEYISGRNTLKDHLYTLGTNLSWIRRLEICLGVAYGLQYLHDADVLHGDIRSSNILMTEDSLVPKITDYGYSKLRQVDAPAYSRVSVDAVGYIDPCFSYHGGLTMKSDVYSLCVVLLELLCGRPILDRSLPSLDEHKCLVIWFQRCVKSSTDLEGMIDPKVKDEISLKCLDEFFKISKRCLDESPEERPDVPEFVATLESMLTLEKSRNKSAPSLKELTFDDLKKATGGFSQNQLLGHEAPAALRKVYLGTLAPSEEEAVGIAVAVVVKSIPHDDWLEEANFMGQLVHSNIIKLLGCYSGDGHQNMLVYEHMQRSLHHFLHGDDSLEPLSWEIRLNILLGVARGMAYLYTDKGIVCNFQCDDILLDEDLNAKLGGFGWAEVQKGHDAKQLKGVFGYLKADYDTDCGQLPMNDVFSFGLVVLETITARHAYLVMGDLESLEMGAPKSKSNKNQLKKIIDPRLQGNYSSKGAFSCMALASRCIVVQPDCRPSWEEIVWILEKILALSK